jgi:phosphatidylserine decarboxylase
MSAGRSVLPRLIDRDSLTFALTNHLPRRLATRFMGWFSRIEHPLLCRVSLAVWQRFGGDLQLHEARKTRFASIHDCFVRELKPGARPIDGHPHVLVSPCDADVVSVGRVNGTELIQAKGFTYTLEDLPIDPALVDAHRDGHYVTLRLRSTMYHRFHAPDDCTIDEVIHVPGDTWNVNPITLERIDRVYCRNERAVLRARLSETHEALTLVPVAAILVASIQLHCLDAPLSPRYRGPSRLACRATFRRGDEIGYFHHGSTIILLAGRGRTICPGVRVGASIRMGQRLLERVPSSA